MTRLGILAAAIVLMPYSAYVLMHLWNWFIAPLGLVTVGLWQAMGISVFATFIRARVRTEDKTTSKHAEDLLNATIMTTLIWGMGWVVHALGALA